MIAKYISLSAAVLLGCVESHQAPLREEEVSAVEPPAEPMVEKETPRSSKSLQIPITLDVSPLSPSRQAMVWHSAEWLNEATGMTVVAQNSALKPHVRIRASTEDDCPLVDVWGYAYWTWSGDHQPRFGSAHICILFEVFESDDMLAADGLIAHEILHTLGAEHEDDRMSLMNRFVSYGSDSYVSDEVMDLLQNLE